MSPNGFAGKVALITGAARRIGAAITSCLHKNGMNVAIHFRESADEAAALAQDLNALRPDSAATFGGLYLGEISPWRNRIETDLRVPASSSEFCAKTIFGAAAPSTANMKKANALAQSKNFFFCSITHPTIFFI